MSARVFITGGRGTVGRHTAEQAKALSAEVFVGTRSPSAKIERRFDWQVPETFCSFDQIQAVLVVAPPGATDALSVMQPGLEAAMAGGVTRFVLVGASMIEKDGPLTGSVYGWLAANAPEWVVLRPSWFMQNFSEGQHRSTIRDEDRIYSATGNGGVPFIDATDIGRVAAYALCGRVPSGELILTGPELMTYRDVAMVLSDLIGRRIEHCSLTEEAMAARFVAAGLPFDFAATLASMDSAIRRHSEERLTDSVHQVTGVAPETFYNFATPLVENWM